MARRTLNDDLFFFNTDDEYVVWEYHNPDSNTDGQFVINKIHIAEIQHLFAHWDFITDHKKLDSKDFFAMGLWDDSVKCFLIDKGTDDYASEKKRFLTVRPDAIGLTKKTLSKIITTIANHDVQKRSQYLNPYGDVAKYAHGIEGEYPNDHNGEITNLYENVLLYIDSDYFIENSYIHNCEIKDTPEKLLWVSNTHFKNVDISYLYNAFGVHFTDCTFENCTAKGCNFHSAKFKDCQFHNFEMVNCILNETQMLGNTNLRDLMLTRCEISGLWLKTKPRENPKIVDCIQSRTVRGLDLSPVEKTDR